MDGYLASKKRPVDANAVGSQSQQNPELKRPRREERPKVELTSVQQLWDELDKKSNSALKTLFREAVFVGCADESFFFIQSGTKLYLMDGHVLSKQLMYQEIIRKFSFFGAIELATPTSIKEIILVALELPEAGWEESAGTKEQIATDCTELLSSRAEMTEEYFALKIDEDRRLCSIPSIVDGCTPELDRLPMLLLRLATDVDWTDEKPCFRGIATCLAEFYSYPYQPLQNDPAVRKDFELELQHQVFPLLKKRLLPPQKFCSDGTIVQTACLEKLYQIFERC